MCKYGRPNKFQNNFVFPNEATPLSYYTPHSSAQTKWQSIIKPKKKKKIVVFNSSEALPYNQPISLAEVLYTIRTYAKNSAPGPDQITPTMLKHLHPTSISFRANLLSRIFLQAHFPTEWKITTVISILKPQKDPTSSLSYRPISLLGSVG